MKRLISLVLCVSIWALCMGCSAPSPSHTLSVVATVFPPYDFARQISGGAAQVQMLLPPGGEVHAFEPSLRDMAAIENCDVFIYNGGESDGWVEELLSACDTQGKTVIRMMDCVELLAVGEEQHEHHHGHEHTEEEADEHIWTTPENALGIAQAIAAGMTAQDPDRKAVYEQGFAALEQQLTALGDSYEGLRSHDGRRLVFADRFPFLYLAHAYHLNYVAAFSGCTSNTEADLATLYTLKKAAEQASRVVLYTEFSDGVLAETVAKGVGGTTARLHSCHNVTKTEWEQGVTYVSLMKQNLTVLKEALGL